MGYNTVTEYYFFLISSSSFHTMNSFQGLLTLALTMVLLAIPSLSYGETLYVQPTSMLSTSCPAHLCHTLSEYAQDPDQYFNSPNLTLQFLPGDHTFNVNLTITSIHQLVHRLKTGYTVGAKI